MIDYICTSSFHEIPQPICVELQISVSDPYPETLQYKKQFNDDLLNCAFHTRQKTYFCDGWADKYSYRHSGW